MKNTRLSQGCAAFVYFAMALCGAPRAAPAQQPPAPAATVSPPSFRGEQPPTWPRVGGHWGIAVPIVNIASDDVTVIGADFVQVGIAPGATIKLSERWAIDLEFIAFSRWQFAQTAAPASVRTIMVVDPGLVYNFGPLLAGLRTAVQISEGMPFNFGVVPIVNKGFPLGRVSWFVELDLPFFVYGEPNRSATVSFTPLLQTGLGF